MPWAKDRVAACKVEKSNNSTNGQRAKIKKNRANANANPKKSEPYISCEERGTWPQVFLFTFVVSEQYTEQEGGGQRK
jgi:hypothetical protein